MTEMIYRGTPADMCPCPDTPINEWIDTTGQIIQTRTVTADTGETDGEDFNRSGAIGWRIVCPNCRKLYAWSWR